MVKQHIKCIFIYYFTYYFTYFCQNVITGFITEQKTSTLPEKSQYAEWLFQKEQNFNIYDFRGK
jgi:hypothetical protein